MVAVFQWCALLQSACVHANRSLLDCSHYSAVPCWPKCLYSLFTKMSLFTFLARTPSKQRHHVLATDESLLSLSTDDHWHRRCRSKKKRGTPVCASRAAWRPRQQAALLASRDRPHHLARHGERNGVKTPAQPPPGAKRRSPRTKNLPVHTLKWCSEEKKHP